MLMTDGHTGHSKFIFPLQLNESLLPFTNVNCPETMKLSSERLILWDEAHSLACVIRLLQDIRNSYILFRSKVVVLDGDFLQVLPVTRHGTQSSVVHVKV